jgi:hypothetical protein
MRGSSMLLCGMRPCSTAVTTGPYPGLLHVDLLPPRYGLTVFQQRNGVSVFVLRRKLGKVSRVHWLLPHHCASLTAALRSACYLLRRLQATPCTAGLRNGQQDDHEADEDVTS